MSHLDYERGLYEGVAAQQHQYAAGRRDGWDEAVDQMTPRYEALERELDALQQERDNIAYAANAMGVIARAMQAVIANGTRDQQVEVINRYNALCDMYLNNGVLRTEPHNDPTAQEREGDVASFFPKLARQLDARSTPDDDYSP